VAKTDYIHFSDGKKAICNAKDVVAVTDEQRVTCGRCKEAMAAKAEADKDPLVKVKVKNMDIPDGTDFAFSFGRDPAKPKEMKNYRLVSNEIHMLPRSVVKHLRTLSYPYKRYVPGQESGNAMQVAGKYDRFVIQEL